MIIGYSGLTLLIISFIILNTKFIKYFLFTNLIGTTLLTVHGIIIKDIVTICANGFIILMLIVKLFYGGLK